MHVSQDGFMSRARGFSLIEVMVVVAIVGILASIAVPSYSDYVTRGRIPEATSQLAAKRVQMEQFFQDNQTYVGGPGCTSDSTSSKFFTFDCDGAATATTYTLRAAGRGPMTGFVYTVNQSNQKATTITGVSRWTGNASCWVTAKGGAC